MQRNFTEGIIAEIEKNVDLFINRAFSHLPKETNQPMKDLLLGRALHIYTFKEFKQPLDSNGLKTNIQSCIVEAFYNTFNNEQVFLNTLFATD